MIDVRAASEAYQRGEISKVGWISSSDNIVDGLSKVPRSEALERFLNEGVIRHKVEHWVSRNHFDDSDLPAKSKSDKSSRILREQGPVSLDSQRKHGEEGDVGTCGLFAKRRGLITVINRV